MMSSAPLAQVKGALVSFWPRRRCVDATPPGGKLAERLVVSATVGHGSVELAKPADQVGVVLRDGLGPPVGADDGLVEVAVRFLQREVGALVDGVVQLCQPELVLGGELRAQREQLPAGGCDARPLLLGGGRGPGKGLEGGRRGVAEVLLERGGAGPGPMPRSVSRSWWWAWVRPMRGGVAWPV